jgi:hypothetical protein
MINSENIKLWQTKFYERIIIMLYKAKALKGYKLHGIDGEIGKIEEFYFDDKHWTIRYLVAETGDWLMDRQVLITPHVLYAVNQEEHYISVDLTKKQIEDSPSLEAHKPVSRQFEMQYYGYYGWPLYWEGPFIWGSSPTIMRNAEKAKNGAASSQTQDSHLRSTADVSGHNIQASDGEIGHVEDFIIDDETWAIRYLIIDTKNWWPGKKVLVSPKWIERISWEKSKVYVNLFRETIKLSPEFTEEALITRDYEADLHRHYHREGYWVNESETEQHSH